MKHFLLTLLVFCIFSLHAEKNSQFLKLLSSQETVVEKKSRLDSEAKITVNLKDDAKEVVKNKKQSKAEEPLKDRFYQLLSLKQNTRNSKKLYKNDLTLFDFKYINHLEYLEDCKFPEFDEEQLNPTEKELATKYGKLLAQGAECSWYLKHISEEIGYGAFAGEDIEEGQIISEYTGIVFHKNKLKDIELSYGWLVFGPQYCRDFNTVFYVDGRKAGNFTRYINHSSYPNVGSVIVYSDGAWHMVYIANKHIEKDEQLLVDYGAGYWVQRTCKPIEMGL